MNEKEIYIVGAGTYGEAMFELAEILGYEVIGFYDEDETKINSFVMGIKIMGKFSSLSSEEIKGKQFIVAIGNNEVRHTLMHIINELEGKTPTLIHPKAIISPSARIGNGVYIQANAYLWTKVKVNDFCIISPGVVIAHHSLIGKACLISTLSGIGASVTIEDQVFVGMGATVVTGVSKIGSKTVIGAGTVVLNNLDNDSVYAGVPARKLEKLTI